MRAVTLDILQIGAPLLRQPSSTLSAEDIQGPAVQSLIGSMRETLEAAGVGLAAPQVGVPIQLAVIEDRCRNPLNMAADLLEAQERTPVPFHVLINPIITRRDGPDVSFFEGCLSVSGYRAVVSRSKVIEVECLDECGTFRRIRANGWYARILQHEIDHLNGMLYVDRMNARTLMTNEMYQRYWLEKSVQDTLSSLGIPTIDS
jgi:peptide deformylase